MKKITKSTPIGTIDPQNNNGRLSRTGSLSDDYYEHIAVISGSIPRPNVPKKTTVASISIL